MLQKLTIKNFQAHKNLEVDLDPRVTTIVGPSDVGKSAVIRAIGWLATNRPSGDNFIREGSKSTSVTLTVDKHEIQRHRGKSVNSYSLDEQEFKAFGNDVPQEVLDLLNLSEVNFQGQHDSPFWFCETAGEVSRQLNRIVDLSIIDSTLANLDKANRDARAKIKVVEDQLAEAKAKRSSLTWTKEADKDLKLAEAWWATKVDADKLHQSLHDTIETVREASQTVKQKNLILKDLDKIIELGEKASDAHRKVQNLTRLVEDIEVEQSIIEMPIPDLDPLFKLQDTIREVEGRVEKLSDLIQDVKGAQEDVEDAKADCHDAQQNYENARGDVCPLCEKPW